MNQDTKKQEEDSASFAFMAGFIAMLLWSTTAIANKIAIAYMDGLSAGILRSLLAGILAVIIGCVFKYPFPSTTSDRALLLVSGVSSFAIWPALVSVGIEHTSVGHGALIMALIPIFTVLFSSLVDRKTPNTGWWVGAAIALLATALLIFTRLGADQSFNSEASTKGDLIILVGGMLCAIGYVAGGKLAPRIGAEATTFWGLSIALLILIPVFYKISGNTDWANMANKGWYAIIWMSLLSSIAGYALWFFALGRGGVRRIGSTLLAMPVITLCFAHLVLNEPITVFMLVICAGIVVGTYQTQKYAT